MVQFTNEAIAQSIEDAADDLLNAGNALSPQLSGAHIASGKVTAFGQFGRVVGYDQPYSVRLHFSTRYKLGPISRLKPGTSDGAPGPGYLSRPFDNRKQRWIRDIGVAINDSIRRAVR